MYTLVHDHQNALPMPCSLLSFTPINNSFPESNNSVTGEQNYADTEFKRLQVLQVAHGDSLSKPTARVGLEALRTSSPRTHRWHVFPTTCFRHAHTPAGPLHVGVTAPPTSHRHPERQDTAGSPSECLLAGASCLSGVWQVFEICTNLPHRDGRTPQARWGAVAGVGSDSAAQCYCQQLC